MKEYKISEIRRILSNAGYLKSRTNGDHEIWSNGQITIAVPTVGLKPIISHKILKSLTKGENNAIL